MELQEGPLVGARSRQPGRSYLILSSSQNPEPLSLLLFDQGWEHFNILAGQVFTSLAQVPLFQCGKLGAPLKGEDHLGCNDCQNCEVNVLIILLLRNPFFLAFFPLFFYIAIFRQFKLNIHF